MRIGIITYFHPINYGAFLQSYALSSRLNQIDGVTAEVLNFRYPIEDKWYSRSSLKYFKANRFNLNKMHFDRKLDKAFCRDWKKLKLSDEEIISDDINLFVSKYRDKYDVIIAGSDEIWKANGYRGFPTVYWLPGELNCRKLSYAASARIDFSKLPQDDQERIREYLNQFEVIGVRDKSTEKSVKKATDYPERVRLCCDPVFVYDFKPDRNRGRQILQERFEIDITKPVLGIMMSNGKIENELRKLQKSNSYEIVSLYQYTKGFKNAADLSPLEWVDVIAGLDFLITRFFHATSFAILSGTPFLAVDTHAKNRSDSKICDLLSHFGIEERCISNADEALKNHFLSDFIENSIVNGREDHSRLIQSFRAGFEDYLKLSKIIAD